MELLRPIKIKKRKSGFEDSFFFIAVIFAIAIFIIVVSKAWTEMATPLDEGLTAALPANSNVNITKTFDKITATTLMFDKLLPFILIGLFAFVFIGAAVYMNHPIMIIVGIIILGVAVMLSVIYANIYHQISGSDEFTSTTDNFIISNTFMNYLPFILIIVFIGIMVAIIWSRGGAGGKL